MGRPTVGIHFDCFAGNNIVTNSNSGRRKLCLVFCVTYSLSCACIAIPSVPILFIGRLLGGFSTSILFSAFESWVISSAGAAGLPSADLSTIMGRATLTNGVVATVAGVVSNQLVGFTHNFWAPFVASGLLLMIAWYIIRRLWSENYGSQSATDQDVFQFRRLGKAWHIVRMGA
jgi:MFS family permease